MPESMILPDTNVDYREAEKALLTWLKGKDLGIMNCREWARWSYNDRPFWSVWGLVYGRKNSLFSSVCGIHIYDDGEIIIVSKDDTMPEL